MFSINVPRLKSIPKAKNSLGLSIDDYKGAPSTLCGGCGHDSITQAIVEACFELSIVPHQVAKMSGIGCSSKTPGYFLREAHGFNAVHGRMPSVTTGAYLANREMKYLAVSGDGDTGSIGLGQFMHAIRRQLNMVYIVENNGVYGLTKGQFSATADYATTNKKKEKNGWLPIDLVGLALELGASYVARAFSGDKAQLVPLIKGALSHKGFAFLDVLSPCVSFNNHQGSSKSYQHIRDKREAAFDAVDFVPPAKAIELDYQPGMQERVQLFDGSQVLLHKTDHSYDPTDVEKALAYLRQAKAKGEIATGLFYVDSSAEDFHTVYQTTEGPLRNLEEVDLSPGQVVLDKINDALR